ncbi:Obscurin [Varanus komodoensis]|nr:Obscurin [Varanus komodoensis]
MNYVCKKNFGGILTTYVSLLWKFQCSLGKNCGNLEPPITIVETLKDITLYENEDAMFQCQVSSEKAKDVQWSLAGVPLQSNEMNEIEVRGKRHILTLRKVSLEDSGCVSFRVGQNSSEAQLTVQCKLASSGGRNLSIWRCQSTSSFTHKVQLSESHPLDLFSRQVTYWI